MVDTKILWVAIGFLIYSSSGYGLDTASRIDRVVVYSQGATVTRIAELALPAGESTVRLTGLVSALNLDDLQVELGNSAVEIGQVKLDKKPLGDAYSTEVRKLQKKITAKELALKTIDDENQAAKLQLAFIKSISEGYAKEAWSQGARGNADITSWQAALTIIESGSGNASKVLRDNEAAIKDINKTLSQLRRELRQMQGKSRSGSVVEVVLNTAKPVSTHLRLHYFQHRANWRPLYESRLDSDAGRLTLAQQAKVNQSTDESWDNAAITLSTSEPTGELAAPEPFSEFLGLRDPYTPKPELKRSREYNSVDDFSTLQSVQLKEVVVTDEEQEKHADIGSFAVNYAIPGRVTVPNNSDDAVNFDLARYPFDVELVTQVVPRESTEAFLAARFVYDQKLPLYRSEMRVYVDGVYVGVTQMPNTLPQAEVTLPVGQDRRIEINVTSQGGKTGEEGVISKRKRQSTDFLFEITNRRSHSNRVEVYDRYPVARNKAIEISVPKSATVPTEKNVDDVPGLIVWRSELAPNQPWRIRHQYSVSYPAKYELVSERE